MCTFCLILLPDVENEEFNSLFSFDSKEKQQTLDEPSITTPTCVHLRVSSEQTISQNSDLLLPTTAIQKHSILSDDTSQINGNLLISLIDTYNSYFCFISRCLSQCITSNKKFSFKNTFINFKISTIDVNTSFQDKNSIWYSYD